MMHDRADPIEADLGIFCFAVPRRPSRTLGAAGHWPGWLIGGAERERDDYGRDHLLAQFSPQVLDGLAGRW